jgi:hypothetical protein
MNYLMNRNNDMYNKRIYAIVNHPNTKKKEGLFNLAKKQVTSRRPTCDPPGYKPVF